MHEIRFHGRGGQGVVIVSKILGYAAFIEGNYVQCFPEFGVERRGAPVRAFLRVSGRMIYVRSSIEAPDFIVVLDPFLLRQEQTVSGASNSTCLLVNLRETGLAGDLPVGIKKIYGINGFDIAVKHGLGTSTTPLVNTAVAGAFARSSGLVQKKSLVKAIRKYSPASAKQNVSAALEAYENVTPLKAEVTL